MPSTLSITDLDVAFGARTLFTALDLTLSDGDVTAVVGPNEPDARPRHPLAPFTEPEQTPYP